MAARCAACHVGPMTRRVEDAAQTLTIISRPDSRDWYTLRFDGADYVRGLPCPPVPGGVRFASSPTLGLSVTVDAAIHDRRHPGCRDVSRMGGARSGHRSPGRRAMQCGLHNPLACLLPSTFGRHDRPLGRARSVAAGICTSR
ncbi:hypothetical protein BVI1335_750033 [Burkholderia vietnamiensis]|nr:hypothetical protein BVI1335_750033 [Burkholderia vietnamiensis]